MDKKRNSEHISNNFSLRCRAVYDAAVQGTLSRRYFCGRGYYSFGYWGENKNSQIVAAETLIEKLLCGINSSSGPVLDVACGLGANAEILTRTFGFEAVYGINISEKQLIECESRVPGAKFGLMDATEIKFPENFFSAVFCVEAAFHFDTREKYLRHALRILKPGADLRMTDILYRIFPMRPRNLVPPGNYLDGAEEYKNLLAKVGFVDIEITSIWKQSWIPFRSNLLRWLFWELCTMRMSVREVFFELPGILISTALHSIEFRDYLLIKAKKSKKI